MWIRKHKENRLFQKSSENCRNFECFLNAFYLSCFQVSGLHLILHHLFAEALIPVALLSMDWNSSVSCSLRHCDEFLDEKRNGPKFPKSFRIPPLPPIPPLRTRTFHFTDLADLGEDSTPLGSKSSLCAHLNSYFGIAGLCNLRISF